MSEGEPAQRLVDHPLMPNVGDAVGGRYEIQKMLGEGGFGAVYLATDLRAGGKVALKVLDPGKSGDPAFVKRFEQEVRVVRSLSNHHTIKIWDVGETETGCAFMAMEFVEGEPLSALIARAGALEPVRVFRIAKQVLQSLGEAHQRGVIHRDLKPDNIMVQQQRGEPDYVKVLDFGIAKAFGELSMVKTGTGVVLCTASYAAPELLRNRGVTAAVDVYALGLILLEMLTGWQAVSGDSLADIIARQMAPDPVPVPPPILEQALGPLIARAVSKDADQRFRDADEMLIALEELAPQMGHSLELSDTIPQQIQLLTGPPLPAPHTPEPVRPRSQPEQLSESGPRSTDLPSQPVRAREGKSRGLGLAVAMILLVGVVVALVVFLGRRGYEGDPDREPPNDSIDEMFVPEPDEWAERAESRRRVVELLERAERNASEGRHQRAIELLLEALDRAPENPDVHRMLFENASALNRPAEAASHLEEYLRLFPDEPNREMFEAILEELRGAANEAAEEAPEPNAGPLPRRVIRSFVASHLPDIRRCAERASRRGERPSGRVELHWLIEPNGSVSSISVESNSTGNSQLAACVVRVVETWEFPRPEGGAAVEVNYPFVFSPQ